MPGGGQEEAGGGARGGGGGVGWGKGAAEAGLEGKTVCGRSTMGGGLADGGPVVGLGGETQ